MTQTSQKLEPVWGSSSNPKSRQGPLCQQTWWQKLATITGLYQSPEFKTPCKILPICFTGQSKYLQDKKKIISFNMCELCKTARALGSSEHPLDSEELAGEAALCLSQTGSSPSLVCKKQASPLASYQRHFLELLLLHDNQDNQSTTENNTKPLWPLMPVISIPVTNLSSAFCLPDQLDQRGHSRPNKEQP